MQEQQKIEDNKLILDGRKHLNLTGVESVDAFSEQALKLTVSGSKVIILGENIKISAFNKSSGVLLADGIINEIKYAYKKEPIIKRIFK